ncbi:MAG: transcription termination/antitermination NusG family protein [Bacillota bacterium]
MGVYVAQVNTGKEAEVAARLRDCGLNVLPVTRKIKTLWGGTKEEAVFRGYIFVETSDAIEAYHTIKNTQYAITLFHNAPLSEVEVEEYLACACAAEVDVPVNNLGTLSRAVAEVFHKVAVDVTKLNCTKPLLDKIRKVIYNPHLIGKRYRYRLPQSLLEMLEDIWQGGLLLGLHNLQE